MAQLSLKKTLAKLLQMANSVTNQVFTWNSGTAGTLRASKWGKVVSLTIGNPTQLANQNNVICTLPVAYRPNEDVYAILATPTYNTVSSTTGLALRAVIHTTGVVEIYNYRGAAISGNTNASQTITYVTAK